jgi:hypothetical protein
MGGAMWIFDALMIALIPAALIGLMWAWRRINR